MNCQTDLFTVRFHPTRPSCKDLRQVAKFCDQVNPMFPEGEIQSASIPTGKYWSNYMAEIQALVQASSMVRDSENEYQQVVFLSDALSVLEVTAVDKHPRL